jgi:pimeloyl-ACP methyl ester carboxylesterase
MRARFYGSSDDVVVLLHGGPGGPGYMAPVAQELSDTFRVVEHLQPGFDQGGRTVEALVQHLRETIVEEGGPLPALVGASWGAMLALCYAAAFPGTVSRVVSIGCGTFDERSRQELESRLVARETASDRRHLGTIKWQLATARSPADQDAAFGALARLLTRVDIVEPIGPVEDLVIHHDYRAFQAVWTDMVRLQQAGVYPQEFTRVSCPVTMLHGREDSHPGRLIYESLRQYVPTLRYLELERCGHTPWLERHARDPFFAALRDALS